MRKIVTLPEHVIAKIAAGEVIERPVYVVKELIENSLDAHSDTITITIENAGLKKIEVSDNGEGMNREDIVQSFKPHTTSKVYEDLLGIKTLGFRGEALSSIAAVSHLTIQSRAEDVAGTEIMIRDSEMEKIKPVGMPPGTIISVQNLFHSLPARKKFLKSERTEFRHILDLVTRYALSFTTVRFVLYHNNREIFDLPKNQSIEDRLKILMGETFFKQLIPIISENSYIRVSGFISRPQASSKSPDKQVIFINTRSVSDRLISSAVREAYGNLLESTHYPFSVLFVTLPQEAVDVNVHPRKEQVWFVDNTSVFNAIKDSVMKTLAENNLTFYNVSFNGQYSSRKGTTSSYTAQVLRDHVEPWNIKDLKKLLKKSDIQQLHNLYLLIQTNTGFLLIDQHAAHERILYEQFLEEFKNQAKNQKPFPLENSIIIDLPFAEAESLLENLQSFKNLGFEIEGFGKNTYIIHAVPKLFKDRDIRMLILELLEELSQGKPISEDHFSTTLIEFLACRAAIKAGDTITKDEGKKLIEKLEETPNNATCPHGRPTKVEISLAEVNKLFKRS